MPVYFRRRSRKSVNLDGRDGGEEWEREKKREREK
jgi:hypothetical protein